MVAELWTFQEIASSPALLMYNNEIDTIDDRDQETHKITNSQTKNHRDNQNCTTQSVVESVSEISA